MLRSIESLSRLVAISIRAKARDERIRYGATIKSMLHYRLCIPSMLNVVAAGHDSSTMDMQREQYQHRNSSAASFLKVSAPSVPVAIDRLST